MWRVPGLRTRLVDLITGDQRSANIPVQIVDTTFAGPDHLGVVGSAPLLDALYTDPNEVVEARMALPVT